MIEKQHEGIIMYVTTPRVLKGDDECIEQILLVCSVCASITDHSWVAIQVVDYTHGTLCMLSCKCL